MKQRHGNSFEIATLLCSLLIGSGYGAMVVSGYASREVFNNDQKRVHYPHIPVQIKTNKVNNNWYSKLN